MYYPIVQCRVLYYMHRGEILNSQPYMLQTQPRQSNTMINTFKVCSYSTSGARFDWSSDQILIHAVNKKEELKARYPETVFSVEVDQNTAFSF